MPIGKIGATAGKGADYSAGSQNIQHNGKVCVVVVEVSRLRCLYYLIDRDFISCCSGTTWPVWSQFRNK